MCVLALCASASASASDVEANGSIWRFRVGPAAAASIPNKTRRASTHNNRGRHPTDRTKMERVAIPRRRRRRPRQLPLVGSSVALLLGWAVGRAAAGQCVFRQRCINAGLDSPCIPELTDAAVFDNGTYANASFPMDAAHGFGVPQPVVWNGFMADAAGNCEEGTADPNGSGQCLTPGGILEAAPIICPQYAQDGCCTWQQNYVLWRNLHTLVKTFGGPQGCDACAVNLVGMWCALICSPDQATFVRAHDPPHATRRDDLTSTDSQEVMAPVLQMDVWLDPSYVCGMYESCKGTNTVAQVTGMQSGLGLLTYQGQTGAVGHGEYFFFHFDTDSNDTAAGMRLFGQPTLDCAAFFDPGSDDVPFPYPPPNATMTACSCTYCAGACEAAALKVEDHPISPLAGFDGRLVLGVYLMLLLVVLAVGLRRKLLGPASRRRGRTAAAAVAAAGGVEGDGDLNAPLLSLSDGEEDEDWEGDEEEEDDDEGNGQGEVS